MDDQPETPNERRISNRGDNGIDDPEHQPADSQDDISINEDNHKRSQVADGDTMDCHVDGEQKEACIPMSESALVDESEVNEISSHVGNMEKLSTAEKSSKPIKLMDDLSQHDVPSDIDKSCDIKSSSKILKGILENNVINYTSDIPSKDHSSKPLEVKKSLESKACEITNKPHQDSYLEEMKEISVNKELNVTQPKEMTGRNIETEANQSKISNNQTNNETLQTDTEHGNEKSGVNLPSTSSSLSGIEAQESIPETKTPSMNVTQASTSTASQNNEPLPDCDKSVDKPIKYRCSTCSCVTKDKRLFDNHSCDRELGSEEDKVKITIEINKEKNSFVCKECNFSNTGHGFEEHLMCHLMLRPYQCLYCKECFINRREISRHVIKSHNGAKMSCALRALRRAKGLIKDVTVAGSLSFMARVAGKVPLEKDPEKKKNGPPLLKTQDGAAKSSATSPQQDQQGEAQNKEENRKDIEEEEAKITNEEIDPEDKQSKSNAAVPFSKLREVLTADNPLQLVEDKESDRSAVSTGSASGNEEKKELKMKEEHGIKIIASYSLHEESSSQEAPNVDENKNTNNSEKPHQPNFIIASPPCTPEPELVSFLGPEHPGLKQSEAHSPLLPPPPLKPAPVHSNLSASSSFDPLQRQSMPAKQEKISNFFLCSFNCTFNSISQSEFLEHLMHFHSTESSFPCYYCGHKSSHIEDMVNHTASHAESAIDKKVPLFNCSLSGCQFGTNMISDFIKHVSTAHKDGNKPACNACVSVFPEVSMLQTHLEENIIHVVNCPHCPCKASERRAILNHISSEHPGKPKMVSVVKQLICRDRKMNGYERIVKEMLPPSLTPAPGLASNSSQGTSVLDQILRRQDPRSVHSGSQSNSSIADALTGSTSTSPRNTPSPAFHGLSPFSSQKHDDTSENERSPTSEKSGFSGVRVKEEIEEIGVVDDFKEAEGTLENNSSYVIDENGVRRRLYVPMSERHAENFRCKFCTFVARDLKRLACHERSHGMPPTRKDRFKCMFCPQGFDSELKFRLHITCHPGLIKFLLYKCKKCEFDSNQKHTIVKHITCNRDRKHRGIGPVEDQYTIISRSLESRVLECEQCSYMTRHKVHMAIHYQRQHGILRDKNDFIIEGLTPLDTPVTSADLDMLSPTSPHDEGSSQVELAKSSPASKKRKDAVSSDGANLSMGEIYERNELFTRLVSQQAALQPGHVLENQARKFKCPICKYLLPKAADLKNHVKRHSEIGQITLVMFRCKYCSCMSTARELLYDHLREKHPGKSIALVKKIVAIDTTETDKSFAETSVEESLQQLEASVHNEIMSAINTQNNPTTSANRPKSSSTSFEQLFVIPQGGETFQHALRCPKCSYNSRHRAEIVQHVTGKHPEVKIISSDDDVDKLAKSTTKDLHRNKSPVGSGRLSPVNSQEEVLIVPDEPIFKEMALCSRCEFSTMLRKDMVLHLQQNHPEISVMGRNSYPVQVSTMGSKLGENVLEESCVVGSGSLDAKLRCLYENYGSQMKCLICGIERPKKFFIHVHILRHLNIYLWKCTFCSHRGLQKYKMVDHIKKIHPGHPMSVRYLRVNVESRVAQFMSQFGVIKNSAPIPDDNEESSEEFVDQSSDDSKRILQKSSGGSCHVLGSDELDEKIKCLYDFSDGLFYKCFACSNQFQRKFAIHRHIIISHLKVALLSCTYCGMQGVEKHQMVDHIIACHQSQPVNFHTNDVDIIQAVADYLAKSSTNDYHGFGKDSPQSSVANRFKDFPSALGSEETAACVEDNYNHGFRAPKSNFLNLGTNYKFPVGSKLKAPGPQKKKKTTGNKNKTIVDPGVIMLGREALDKELCSLYQARVAGQLRCLICRWEFPRKYPLHRHIMLKHLRMNLVACPYCNFDGVEKYTVSTHIKEEHRDQPINIRYIQPDVRTRVRQFLNEMASGSSKIKKRMSSTSSSPSLSMLVKMKREKNLDFGNEAEMDERDEEEDEEENGDEHKERTSNVANQGLVVAMFGKKSKKANNSEDIVIKREIQDEAYEGNRNTDSNRFSEHNTDEEEGEDGDEANNHSSFFDKEDRRADDDDDDSDLAKENARNKLITKFKKMEAYAPGSYRSPTGGKPKALDVITKIKVLKSKEGPITKFYCEKCKFTSVHRSNIVRHIYKIHERYQTHTCPICHYQTLSLILMQTHMRKEHPGAEYKEDSFSFQPPRTKPRSHSLFSLSNSQQRKRKYTKSKPKTILVTPPVPTPSTSSERGPKQYACAYCHYETNTQEDILEHTREKHSQGFANANGPSQFSKKHEDKSKACWERSKKAVKRKVSEGSDSTLPHPKRKFVFEKGDELIQCGHCDVRETSMGRMQHHMECDHAGLSMQFKRIPAWRFVCKTCAVKTMATSKMKYHLNRHVSYRPYTCVNCGAFFPSPDQCRRHARANRHEEQYMYVRNAKKELKVEELLQETRALALKIQDEAFNDPTFDMANIDTFLSKFQDTKHNLKRTGSVTNPRTSSKKVKLEEKGETPVRKQVGKSPQTIGIEMNVTIKCYNCDFQANTVYEVSVHHKKDHPGVQFFWTELDRGFTCDRTGEALPNSDTLPSQSGDVGYSTKISLSAGSNSSRFKCKSCDFSSAVIQAMKSHLKSHQPKGYICPYCSRFFSGKEKLMRHQYCLHKGLSIWVIHLRKSSATATTSIAIKIPNPTSSGNDHIKHPTPEASPANKELPEDEGEEEEEEEESIVEIGKSNSAQLRFVCNDCSFTSDSLLQYRQHLSKAHAAFRQSVKDISAVVSNDEEERQSQSPLDKDANFQCGHCKFQSSESSEIEQHHKEAHSAEEPYTVELRCDDDEDEPEDIKNPILNLEPRVSVQRMSSSTIAWYDDAGSETSDNELEDSFEDKTTELSTLENHTEASFESESLNHHDRIIKSEIIIDEGKDDNSGAKAERDDNEGIEDNFVEEGVSQLDNIIEDDEGENEDIDKTNDDGSSVNIDPSEEEIYEEREDEDVNESEEEYEEEIDAEEMHRSLANDSDEFTRHLGLMNSRTSPPMISESDMMIMEFNGMQRNQGPPDSQENEMPENGADNINPTPGEVDDEQEEGEEEEEEHEEEEDDDDDFDENNVTLASPLPMISLGDGVTVSPDIFSNKSEAELEENQDSSSHFYQ